MSLKPGDLTDDEYVEAFAACRNAVNAEGRPNLRVAVAARLGLTKGQLDNHLDRHTELRERCKLAAGQYQGVEQLLADQGVDPESVIATQMTVNRWGDPEQPNTQLKVRVVPRWTAVLPARADGWKRPPIRNKKAADRQPRTIVVFSDHHAPHHDPDLHDATCDWLRRHKPDEIVIAGDLLDYESVSRHRANPVWAATLQDCIDNGYNILRGYLDAAPEADCTLIAGNHEDRLRNAVLDNLRAAFGVTQASRSPDDQDHAVLSLPHLLRLDELNINFVGGIDSYTAYHHKLTPNLAVRHGHISKKGAGASAVETLRHMRHSCIIGHCHRLAVVHLTEHDIDGNPSMLVGAEAGTMARTKGGLGYAVRPDWQQGFVVVTVWPDGNANARTIPFVDGRLLA